MPRERVAKRANDRRLSEGVALIAIAGCALSTLLVLGGIGALLFALAKAFSRRTELIWNSWIDLILLVMTVLIFILAIGLLWPNP
jgi:protein-S-isoprenylcysteine O-methyltransferase Ste14